MGKTVLQSLDSGNKHKQEVEVVVQFKKKKLSKVTLRANEKPPNSNLSKTYSNVELYLLDSQPSRRLQATIAYF